jgi:transcriptional regulator with XRE-family HTH domain
MEKQLASKGNQANGDSELNTMLGARIRAARTTMGMTLEELAQKVSLTRSFLSQVERGLTSPSLTTLRRIANELGVPVFLLLSNGSNPRNAVVRRGDRRNLLLPNATTTYQLLSPDLNRKIEMLMTRLQVGSATADQPLSHPGEECAFLLKGKVLVEVAHEKFILEEGDTLYFDASLPHRTVNLGSVEAEIISAITPPSF